MNAAAPRTMSPAAVDRYDRSRDVGRGVRREECDDPGHLVRLPEAPERDLLQVFGARLAGLVGLGEPRSLDSAGRDRIDGDLLRAELACHRLRPADHAGPDRVREG